MTTTFKVVAQYDFTCVVCGKPGAAYLQSHQVNGPKGSRIEFGAINTNFDLTCINCKRAMVA